MGRPIRVVLAGINGYGRFYLDDLLDHGGEHGAVLAGVVDPLADRSARIEALRGKAIPVFPDLEAFYARERADLAILSTPIQLHCEHTITALRHGSNVLCEKPLCATVDEAGRMLAAERAHPGLFVAVGYNRSFSPAIRAVKDDIRAGVYGAPVVLKSLVSWPRDKNYYTRNGWAGRLRSPRGEWILDSPLNNAAAHFLHNMFYVCGQAPDASARVARVEAELYRANDIDSFDTCAVRCRMAEGWTAFFYATHAGHRAVEPTSLYVFEKGAIRCDGDSRFVGDLGGDRKTYPGDPGLDGHANKLWQCVARCRGESGAVCGIAAALETTRVVNAAHLSMPDIVPFPRERVDERPWGENGVQRVVAGLADALVQCYDRRLLPSEHGALPYARKGRPIDVVGLKHFSLPPEDGEGDRIPSPFQPTPLGGHALRSAACGPAAAPAVAR